MLTLGDHFFGGHVKGGEQGGSSVADLVVANTLHVPQPHGQQRLGVIESMDLGLLVDGEHHRLVVWVQIKPDDVPHLLDKERVGGQFVAVRLPLSGDASAGGAAQRRSAAIGEPWTTASGSPSG